MVKREGRLTSFLDILTCGMKPRHWSFLKVSGGSRVQPRLIIMALQAIIAGAI